MISDNVLRQMTISLGIGTIVFGALPLVLPRQFARMFGIPMSEGPAADVVIRSVGARDLVSGISILSATLHGGRVTPSLLARALIDGSDAAGVGIAVASGASNVRLLLLGAVALGATAMDLALYLAQRSAAVSASTSRSHESDTL